MMIEVSKRPGGDPVGRFLISPVRGAWEQTGHMLEEREGASPTDEDVLAVAEAMYREAAVELHRTIRAIRSGEFGEVKAAHTAISALRATASAVLEERGKIDKLRKHAAGQVGPGGAIDFDAARAEIGRRLACLRDAGGRG